jgi:RNA polymerase sigma factor (TIGR02999 family)
MRTTAFLDRIRAGDRDAQPELVAAIYDELQGYARGYMRHERRDHTIEVTELAHEALLRVSHRLHQMRDGRHLRAELKLAMQRWLKDHGRRRQVRERKMPLLITSAPLNGKADVVELADALEKLARQDARAADVVWYRVFVGLTIGQTAEVLDVSHGTVENDFRRARAWLFAWFRDGS